MRQDAVAARRDGVVERVDVARIARAARPAARTRAAGGTAARAAPRARAPARARAVGVVVADDGRALGAGRRRSARAAACGSAGLGAELDAVALDLRGHARRHLGALQHDEHVVERRRRSGTRARSAASAPGRAAGGTSRASRAPGSSSPAPRDAARAGSAPARRRPRSSTRCCEIEITSAPVCFATRSAVRCRVPGLVRRDRRVGHQLDVGVRDASSASRSTMIAPSIFASSYRNCGVNGWSSRIPPEKRNDSSCGIADHDQRALARADDVVDRLAQLRARRDPPSASSSCGSRRGSSSDGVRVKPRAAACASGIAPSLPLHPRAQAPEPGPGALPTVAVTRPARMHAAPASCSQEGDSSTISAAKTTAQSGWKVSRIEVVTAGSRGSDVEISSQPTTWDDSASRISQPTALPRTASGRGHRRRRRSRRTRSPRRASP